MHRLVSCLSTVAVLTLSAGSGFAAEAEKLPAGAKVASLTVQPASVKLTSPYAYTQLLVTAELDSGEAIDVTRIATIHAEGVARVSPTGVVRPIGDGAAKLTIALGGKSAAIPVTATGTQSQPAVSFVRDVQPALSKMGCNAGTCHGAAQGKVGFKLSLRGYDPLFDHRALTDDLEGRRFNRAAPERSLMLMKPAGAVPHVGGVLCSPGEPYYELIKAWIAAGVKLDLATPRVTKLNVTPSSVTVPRVGMKQQFAVIATYADGTTRDVSTEAFVDSSNTEVATVDKAGLLTAVRRGEATMLARYEGAYAASTVVIMGDRSGFAWEAPPRLNWIDELVDTKLQKLKILPSGLCTDEEFVRRVYLDLTGLPPSADDVRKFVNDARTSREKRDALVDALVGSPAYVEHWTNKWADLLQVNRKFLGEPGARALREWIKKAVAGNMPYDQFAHAILTASGSNVENPPAAYYKVLRTPDEVMENTTQLFLAVRFNCNKCHDHPFERWTQDQYYETAAFFAQIDRTEDPKYKGKKIGGTAVEGAKPLVEVIADVKTGDVKHERTGAIAPPKFPFSHADMPPANLPRREQAAEWITSPANPYFAMSYVNRMWSYLLGVGIIEPVDDIRAGNPPTNPELLNRLTQEFVASGFDTRKLVTTICKSRTYQLTIATNKWNKDDEQNYSHALPRRLPAEVLFDSIHRATGSLSRLPGLPAGARAAQLLDSNVELPGGFLELFGKPVRESACECERSNTMMLGPVLAMVNGPIVSEAIKDPANHITQFTAAHKDDAQVVEEVYLSVLNRKPNSAEAAAGVTALRSATADFARLTKIAQEKDDRFTAYQKTIEAKQKSWEAGLLDQKPTDWTVLELDALKATSGATFTKNKDGSVLVSGPSAAQDVYTITADVKLAKLTGVRLEVLSDPSLPAKGPGRAENGNIVLNEFRISSRPLNKSDAKPRPVKLVNAVATFSQATFEVQKAIDNNPGTGWALAPEFGKDHAALFPFEKPLGNPQGVHLTFAVVQRFGGNHTIGKFRLSVTSDASLRLTTPVSKELVQMLETPSEKRTEAQKKKLRQLYLAQDAEYRRLEQDAASSPPTDPRIVGAQDLVWALINSPAFLFNH